MEPRTERAVDVAVQVARQLGLRADDPVVLAEGYSVRVHVRPSPVVVRVPTVAADTRPPIRPWLERELAVTRWLSACGAPVVAPTTLVDAGPHEHGGSVVTLWEHVDVDPEPVDAASYGAALRDLHEVLAGYDAALPVLPGPLTDIAFGVQVCERDKLLSRAEHEVVTTARARLAHLTDAPGRALHGDSHLGNLLRTRAGALLWNDWEDVGRGPVEWDLASLTLSDEVVQSYGAGVDAERLADCRDLRRLQVLVGSLAAGFALPVRDEIVAALAR